MLKVRCQVHATVDDKGRLALPAPLRHALNEGGLGHLVLSFTNGALWGWTSGDFEESVEKPIASKDQFLVEVTDFVHAHIATAQDVEVDAQGRIRIPPVLRDLAAIDRDVVVNSLLNRIEVWDKARWEARFRQSLDRRATASGMPKGD